MFFIFSTAFTGQSGAKAAHTPNLLWFHRIAQKKGVENGKKRVHRDFRISFGYDRCDLGVVKPCFGFQKLAALHQKNIGAELFVPFSPERRKSCTSTTEEGAAHFGKSCSFFGRNFMWPTGWYASSPVPPRSMTIMVGFLKAGSWTIKFGHEQWAMRSYWPGSDSEV